MEEKRLRKVIEENWPEHLLELDIALHTGMRRSEQYSLMWSDIDFINRIITIRHTKNGEVRHIRLNRIALAAFETLFARSNSNGYVFTNSRFEHLLNSRHWFEPAIERAEIGDFTWALFAAHVCQSISYGSRRPTDGSTTDGTQDDSDDGMLTSRRNTSWQRLNRCARLGRYRMQQVTPELTRALKTAVLARA